MIDNEERIGATLRAASDGMHARPTLVADVRAGALRRRRRRRVATTALVVASCAAVGGLRFVAGPDNAVGTDMSASPGTTASAAAPGNCRIDRLPVPAGHPRSAVTGGDPSGRFLVGRAYASPGYVDGHPLLIWDDGVPTGVDMPGDDGILADVTGTGVAVGSSFTGTGTQTAYVYRNGALSPLPAPAGSVQARAIAGNGTIVGNLDGTPNRALVWADPDSQPREVPLPDGFASGEAVDVDDDGTVLLKVSGAGGTERASVWSAGGTARLLPAPVVDGKPAQRFWPISVHGGVVFGRAVTPMPGGGTKSHPYLFDLRTGVHTALTHGFGLVGNSAGWIIGKDAAGPFLTTPAGRAVLPTLAGDPANLGLNSAAYLSADGLVVGGQSVDEKGLIQAVRWRCTKVV